MTHSASASFYRVGTAIGTSAAALTANTITPIEGAMIPLHITVHPQTTVNKPLDPTAGAEVSRRRSSARKRRALS
jgi:hypothetical protein